VPAERAGSAAALDGAAIRLGACPRGWIQQLEAALREAFTVGVARVFAVAAVAAVSCAVPALAGRGVSGSNRALSAPACVRPGAAMRRRAVDRLVIARHSALHSGLCRVHCALCTRA
jgi:hypothetical protein